MHGTGNDFLFVNCLVDKAPIASSRRVEFVKKVCDRHFGVGADGLAFLEPSNGLDFAWDFYNSDGSKAEMCGNAARCAALLFSTLKGGQSKVCFETAFGPIKAMVEGPNDIALQTGEIQVLAEKLHFQSSAQTVDWVFQHLDTGVPHAVVELAPGEALQSETHKVAAAELRSHSIVGPRGTNVTLFKPVSDDHIEAVSFERGVEKFTLACGTGVIAAAYVWAQRSKQNTVRVSIPGGQLSVDFQEKLPTLRGPAKTVATITLDKNFFD
jgi:diaminopimelate epimerase